MSDFLSMENTTFCFNSTMLFCIVLVSYSMTRWSLFALGKFRSVSGIAYLIWCVGEVMISALFCALYLVLVSHTDRTFFEISGITFMNLLTTTMYPLGIMWLCFDRHLRNEDTEKPVNCVL